MILVPVKNLRDAKQRLSSLLTAEERLALAQAMCEDVLEELSQWPSPLPVAIVTCDPFARELATRFSFDVISDDNSGETNAIEAATAVCKARGAKLSMVIPADIPLVDKSDLQRVLDSAPAAGAVLVTDAAGRGTNAAWRSPADLFPLRFGNDSFLPHQAAATATGLPLIVLDLPSIARDVDRPEDLFELTEARGDRRSQQLVRGWKLHGRQWDMQATSPST